MDVGKRGGDKGRAGVGIETSGEEGQTAVMYLCFIPTHLFKLPSV